MQEDKRNDIQPLDANASKTKPIAVEKKTAGKKAFSLTKGKWVYV